MSAMNTLHAGLLRPAILVAALAVALPVLAQSGSGAAPGTSPDASSPGQPATGTLGAPASADPYGSSPGQSSDTSASGSGGGHQRGDWWMPGQGRTSIGLNVGRSNFHMPCVPGFACDRRDVYAAISARNMANDMFGGELALVHMGNIERGGGNTSAYGLNVSVVGKTPVMSGLGAFAKLGGVWGETRVGGNSAFVTTGKDRGFGLSLGAGLTWDFTPNLAAVLEWDRYVFHFVGTGRDAVHTTSLGLQWKY